jgi:glyoxylase-like metal-dependent hydrolase (beta-lactamase superfamily II)
MRRDRAWSGGQVTSRAWCLLAGNPGPMTLDGTNTWILVEPGSDRAVVVDPGPDDDGHIVAVTDYLAKRGLVAALIILTHGHSDHSGATTALQRATGAPVRAWRAGGPSDLKDGDVIEVGGLVLRAIATPGHSSDSVTIDVPADAALLTGDTIIGRGTTVVAWPDGDLGDYLSSLERLRDVAAGARLLLPGHGPVLESPSETITEYVEHRIARLDQVRAALAAGARTAEDVVDIVYVGLADELRAAAVLSARAQVEYLLRD